jgi:protease YdgD
MRFFWHSLAIVGIGWGLLCGPLAQAKEWTGLGAPDDERPRLVVDATYYPFSAMGRLQIAGQAFCGATLVGPKVIITAGHCLWNHRRKAWWAPRDIHFVAGYQRSSFIAHAQGVRYLSPLVDQRKAPDQASIINDWALIELDRPIGKQVGWLGLKRETPETISHRQGQQGTDAPGISPLFLAAYRSDRAHALSLQSPCKITRSRAGGRVFYSDCQVVPGSSGSAVVSFENGQFLVFGVISARLRLRDRPTQTAVVSAWALSDPAGLDGDRVAGFAPQWEAPWVGEATLKKGMETLISALLEGPRKAGSTIDVLDGLLWSGPQEDKIALPPMQFPELQKCRGDCAASGVESKP